MPQADMPAELLETYRGKSPRPSDWAEYWDQALAELDQVDPDYLIEPDEDFQVPGVQCSHLWFTGVGGARIHAQLMRPTAFTGRRPAMLLFHGYEGHSHDYFEKLPIVMTQLLLMLNHTEFIGQWVWDNSSDTWGDDY